MAPRDLAALIASTRFGFAARGRDLQTIGQDPKGWVLAQLKARPPLLSGALPGSAGLVAEALTAQAQALANGKPAAAPASLKQPNRDGEAMASAGPAPAAPPRKENRDQLRAAMITDIGARLQAAIDSDTPLLERLVHFWSNHFTVSALRPIVRGFVGAYEREAIRPHVTGKFADMLLATTRHPGMLFYLDNVQSIGPGSIAGRRRGKGLNENLAREILELHTLGVDGGYTQRDVEAFARILTGWTIARPNDPNAGQFRYVAAMHEPGAKSLLGRTYREDGVAEAEAALRDLARHPSTARHVATKLVRHFVADEPPKGSVDRVARVFQETDGDLARVTAAVVEDPAAWQAPFAKLRTPTELVIGACRVAQIKPPAEAVAASLRALDQPAFLAPSPAGWPDVAAAWAGPEAVLRRAEWCQTFASRLPQPPDPTEVAVATFGDGLPEETMQMIRRAPSRREGLALLLASPQFQRR